MNNIHAGTTPPTDNSATARIQLLTSPAYSMSIDEVLAVADVRFERGPVGIAGPGAQDAIWFQCNDRGGSHSKLEEAARS